MFGTYITSATNDARGVETFATLGLCHGKSHATFYRRRYPKQCHNMFEICMYTDSKCQPGQFNRRFGTGRSGVVAKHVERRGVVVGGIDSRK